MPLIQRLLWHPLRPATCEACGAALTRPRAMLFYGWLPAMLFIVVLLGTLLSPTFAAMLVEYRYVWLPLLLIVQFINSWFEFQYSPIIVKAAGKR
jgi:hypothetical protein